MPKPQAQKEIVYDDDTSDSDEEIEAFKAKVTKADAESSDDDEEESDEEVSDDENSDEEESDEPNTETKSHRNKEAVQTKLKDIRQTLSNVKTKASESSSESEEEESDEPDDEESESEEESIGKYVKAVDPPKRKADQEESEGAKKQKLEEDSDEERKAIRSELSQMSIEEIQKLKEKIGLKLYNQALGLDKKKTGKRVFKRENKNRPREVSSRKQVPRLRDVVGLKAEQKETHRDPRFDSLCGDFDDKIFKESFKFVDDIRSKEKEQLKKELEEEEDPERIRKIKYLLQRMENQEREKTRRQKMTDSAKEEKRQNRDRMKAGEKPVFKSKAEKQVTELVEKYEDLKKTGRIDKYIKKKNKKILSKDRKRLSL